MLYLIRVIREYKEKFRKNQKNQIKPKVWGLQDGRETGNDIRSIQEQT